MSVSVVGTDYLLVADKSEEVQTSEAERQPVRFLVVDDNQAVLESYRHVFAYATSRRTSGLHGDLSEAQSDMAEPDPADLDLVLCHQGDEAVEAVRVSIKEDQPFAAAFIDVRMPPGPDGVWTAEQIRDLDPYIHIIMVTAYSDFDPEDIARRVPPAHRLLYIQKPFHAVEIRRFVWALRTKWHAERLSREIQRELQAANERLRRDIAARKRAEQRLAESEDKYRNLVENIRDVIIQISAEGILQYVSPAIKKLAGYDPEAHLGHHIAEYIAEADRSRIAEAIQAAAKNAETKTIEFGMICSDGQQLPVEVSALPLVDGSRVAAFQCVLRDITQRKRWEEKIQAERDRAQRYFDVAGVLLAVIDEEEKIRRINQKGCDILGYSEEELIGQNWFDLLVPEGNREEMRGVFGQLIAGEVEPVEYYENPLLTKSGEEKLIAFHNSVLTDAGGNTYAALCSGEDITERKEAAKERESLQQQLFQAQKLESLGTLAGGVAHDFNNLLTGMIGLTELALQHTDPGCKVYEYLHKVPQQGKRAAELIASLLAFSRRTVSEKQPLALLPVVKETGRVLERTLPETITVRMLWPDQLSLVKADPTQMQQVIMNLATNARDAMPKGGQLTIEVTEACLDEEYCRRHANVSAGDYVCLSVRDTGCGMSSELQEQIFDPFFTTKEVGEGTGLGLAMVYGIVRDHGGHIQVCSEVDVGTEVKVYLPVSNGSLSESSENTAQHLLGGSETLLLVEDDSTVLKTGRAMLESLGYTVLTATNGKEGLEVYESHQDEVALVLTDMTMPEMSGDELYEAITTRVNPDVKVLLVSGYSARKKVSELRDQGLKGIVQKPFDLQKIAKAVREAIDS